MFKIQKKIFSLFIFLWISSGTTSLLASDLLKQQDELSIRSVLEKEAPGLNIHSVKLISTGWDNFVAEVNGEWIFRFPRTEAFCSLLERECILLDYLHGKITMPIPYYEFKGSDTIFVGYRKILGQPLEEELYFSLSEEVRQHIAGSLALFLHQLHQSVSIEQAIMWGYKNYEVPFDWIENDLFGTLPSIEMERIVKEALEYAKANPTQPDYLVLTHNDLHGDNFAFDPILQQVSGVFDFSDAIVGDYAIEFAKLFLVDQDLAIRCFEAYNKLNGSPNRVTFSAADFILRRAFYILRSRKNGDTFREKEVYQMLEKFVPVWDNIK
jgi:aminoglycoside 2''-phosphotransferase